MPISVIMQLARCRRLPGRSARTPRPLPRSSVGASVTNLRCPTAHGPLRCEARPCRWFLRLPCLFRFFLGMPVSPKYREFWWECFAPERSISGLRVLPMTKIAQLCFFRVMNRPLNCICLQKCGRSILPRPRAGPLAGAGERGSRNLPAGRSGSCVRKRRCFGRDRIWIFV